MLFLYCKEMKLYMSYYICHIDVYIFDNNCDKIKTKIPVLIKSSSPPMSAARCEGCRRLSLETVAFQTLDA